MKALQLDEAVSLAAIDTRSDGRGGLTVILATEPARLAQRIGVQHIGVSVSRSRGRAAAVAVAEARR